MAEEVARRVDDDALFTGVDALESNRLPFTRRVRAARRQAHFVPARLDAQLDWPTQSFDLVVASYSLYFLTARRSLVGGLAT